MTKTPEDPWPETAAAELRTETPDRCPCFTVARDVGAVMRDGVRLSANVFTPEGDDPWPTVLVRQPYGKDLVDSMWARGKYWARKGYACVVQDVRGTFGSQGEWAPFVHEARDGWDTLEWLARQPWCNGAIGMSGESYHGYTQWAVAGSGHPNLKCISPGDASPDPYRMSYRGGAFSLGIGLWACMMTGREMDTADGWDPWHLPLVGLDAAMGRSSSVLQEMLRHPSRDDFWDKVDMTPTLADVRIPVLHWGGWYDVILQGTLLGWERAAARERKGDGAEQRLIIGPTDHARLPAVYGASGVGGEDAPGAWCFDHVQRFFDHHLRGETDALAGVAPVRVYVMGAERWREASAWPLPETRYVDYYLRGGGGASTAAGDGRLEPALPGDEPPDHFDYDPELPVDVWLAESAWDLTWTLKDRAAAERRSDVLVYTSPAMEEDLEVTGPVCVTLFASSSAPDTDFTATLVDAFPDGYAHLVQEGIVRARYRRSDHAPELVTPDAVEEYTIDLLATSHLFARGHRLRLEISSSNFGRFDRNPNSGGAFALDTICTTARQTVHHSRACPSRITLPVILPGAGVATPATGAPLPG
ncbi:MAG TPA: CocE/NonD family hydrolase [Thermoleophilia bacterium]|nr:CocE/NonD family hydrolase [Thermoleophilia bacterium]